MTYDQRRARAVAEAAIREAALVKNHPPDLINVALERLVEASLELPAFSTLDEMATSIRAEVNAQIFAGIVARMGPDGRQRALGPLNTAGLDGRSMFNRLKKPAQRATWSRFKAQAEYLDEVDALGDTARGWKGSPRRRSPTLPGRRPPRTPTRCRGTGTPRSWRFDAGTTQIRRAVGHPSAPVTTEALVMGVRARVMAIEALTSGQVTDEALTQARDAHLFGYADYIARHPVLAAAAPPGAPQLYAPITADDTVSNCCRHLVFALGMELMYPEQAERMRQARACMRRPGPAAFGLTEADIRRQRHGQ